MLYFLSRKSERSGGFKILKEGTSKGRSSFCQVREVYTCMCIYGNDEVCTLLVVAIRSTWFLFVLVITSCTLSPRPSFRNMYSRSMYTHVLASMYTTSSGTIHTFLHVCKIREEYFELASYYVL